MGDSNKSASGSGSASGSATASSPSASAQGEASEATAGPSLGLLGEAFGALVDGGGDGSDDNSSSRNSRPAALRDGSVSSSNAVSTGQESSANAVEASSSSKAATLVEGGRIRIDDDDDVFNVPMAAAESIGSNSFAMEGITKQNSVAAGHEESETEDTSTVGQEHINDQETATAEDGEETKSKAESSHAALATSSSTGTSVADDDDDDEDVRKAMAMAELMQTHPHLSPEELSKRASELVGDSQKRLLPPPKKSMLEEALSSKQGQGLMAALKETGIIQSVSSTDSGAGHAAAAAGGGSGVDGTSTSPTDERLERPNVLAGFKNVQESFRQQQSKVTKNLKDFGLMKEVPGGGASVSGGAAAESGSTAPVAEGSGSALSVGVADFGGGSPVTIRRAVVASEASATSRGEALKSSVESPNSFIAGATPSSIKSPSFKLGENRNESMPIAPDLDVDQPAAIVEMDSRTSAQRSPNKSAQTPSQSALQASAASSQSAKQGPIAIPKLFAAAGKGDMQGFSLNEPGAALSSLVWKRRSGLGKLQKNAWERRRLILRGGVVCYFRDEEEKKPDLSRQGSGIEAFSTQSPSTIAPDPTDPTTSTEVAGQDLPENRRQTWWEQATMNIQKQAAELTQQVATSISEGNLPGAPPADPNAPRGVLDIAKERATFVATAGHSSAPSPFCLSVKVRGETKWKIALKTRSEQMKWLAALTDVVVKMSVEEYNDGLKVSVESSRSLGAEESSATAPSHKSTQSDGAPPNSALQNPLTNINVPGFLPAAPATSLYSSPPGGKENIWRLDAYSIHGRAGSIGGDYDDDEWSDISNEGKLQADDDAPRSSKERTLWEIGVLSSSLRLLAPALRDKWVLEGDSLCLVLILLNWTIFYSRMSSTSIDRFWFVTVAINTVVWICLKKGDTSGASLTDRGKLHVEELDGKEKKKRKRSIAEQAVSVPELPVIKPRAGSTLVRVRDTEEKPTNKEGHRFCGFRALPSSDFQVRSHGYLSTKQKIPCPGELYRLVAMDIFESDEQYRDMAKRVKLPSVSFKDEGGEKTWHSPDIFVVSVSLPTEAPKIGRPELDGVGFTVTMYFVMKQSTRDILRRVTSPGYDPSQDNYESNKDVQKRLGNGIKLWEEWCRRAPSDPSFQARFKFLPFGSNLAEIGMPSWILKYNGKPVLIKRAGVTGFLFDHPELNAMCFDITLHPFPYLAKQATSYMADSYFKKMIASFAFVIEGRSDDELPEVLIGQGSQLCYPDPAIAIKAGDLFTGKSPSAHDRDTPNETDEEPGLETEEEVTNREATSTSSKRHSSPVPSEDTADDDVVAI
mmetsp:Transcript_12601/g.26049  ORF Transcript_12601/g.26049 Transcript_12601/m.26049 type:complete len:1316 (+) Transcript_12601:81-4028(+)